jgi:hypothetical protein
VLTQVSSLVKDANIMWLEKTGGGFKLSGTCFNGFKPFHYSDQNKEVLCYTDKERKKWNKHVQGGTLVMRASDDGVFCALVGYRLSTE